MTDYEKMLSIFDGKQDYKIKSNNEGKQIEIDSFSFVFNNNGDFLYGVNLRY
jgi:hypothetical protein